MNTNFSRPKQALLVGVSAVLVGAGAFFFTRQDLGAADQYASVASFFVGVLGLVVAALPLFAKRTSPMPKLPLDVQSSAPGNVSNSLKNCTNVQTGPRSVMFATVPAAEPTRAESRRNGKKKQG